MDHCCTVQMTRVRSRWCLPRKMRQVDGEERGKDQNFLFLLLYMLGSIESIIRATENGEKKIPTRNKNPSIHHLWMVWESSAGMWIGNMVNHRNITGKSLSWWLRIDLLMDSFLWVSITTIKYMWGQAAHAVSTKCLDAIWSSYSGKEQRFKLKVNFSDSRSTISVN